MLAQSRGPCFKMAPVQYWFIAEINVLQLVRLSWLRVPRAISLKCMTGRVQGLLSTERRQGRRLSFFRDWKIFCKDLAQSAIFCILNTKPGMSWLVRVSGFLQSILLKSARKLPRHCVKIESKTHNSVTMVPCMVKHQLSYFWGGCFIYAWQQQPPRHFWGRSDSLTFHKCQWWHWRRSK